jgi:protein-disulfide isomerase
MPENTEQDPANESSHEQEQAPDQPPTEKAARPMRRMRLTQLAIVVAVVVAAIVVILIATGISGSSQLRPGSVQTVEQETKTLLAGIPQSANVLGRPTAPVTLQWFGDLECPFCKEFALGALPTIIRKWVRDGKLKIEYRSMETATREPKVFRTQQVAALAAGMQDKMWYFIETFYHEQREEDSGYVTENYLQNLARQVPGLKLALWTEDRSAPELVGEVAEDRRIAKHSRFRGTPSFLIGRTGGEMRILKPGSLTSPTGYNEAIEELVEG